MTQLLWIYVTAHLKSCNAGRDVRVKNETAEKLAKAMDQAAVQITGGSDLEAASSEIVQFLEWLAELLRGFSSYAQVRDTLLTMQEPTPATRKLIEGSLRFAPLLVKTWFKSTTSAFLAEQQGQKGHPFAIPEDQHWVICLEISACELQGMTQAKAKRVVAKRRGVHPRTIHRIWLNRSQLPQDGLTMEDAQRFWSAAFNKKVQSLS